MSVTTGNSPHSTAKEPPPDRRIRVGSPGSLLAIVPHLLGFVPARSLVVVGTGQPRGTVKLTLRYDLPDPPDPGQAAQIAAHAAEVMAGQRIQNMIAVGYGPALLVDPLARALREITPPAGFTLCDVLRVEDQRYWSYLCVRPGCPPGGTPLAAAGDPAAVTMAGAGSPVLGSRSELAATLAAKGGNVGESMRGATRRAEDKAASLTNRLIRTGKSGSAARRILAAAGIQAMSDTIAGCRAGGCPDSHDQVALLTVALRDLRVRDDAWARMDPGHREAHLRMWTRIVPLARPGYVAAPASLLAFVAWQCGDGALANVALDRALADQPRYSMAELLRTAIGSGAPPTAARLPMTPEDVAAAYDDLDDNPEAAATDSVAGQDPPGDPDNCEAAHAAEDDGCQDQNQENHPAAR